MADDSPNHLTANSLAGARIWLSGSVPEDEGMSDTQRTRILSFVETFAQLVFERGGYLIHGSHPTFTEPLLYAAHVHEKQGGQKDRLILAVSRHWTKNPEDNRPTAWRETATVHETPEVLGRDEYETEEKSKVLLRHWMADRCDAVVVVGGKWWKSVGGRAGVPLELELALQRGLPCFLLGGLGGAARDYVAQHPEVLARLKNGLDIEANREICTKEDVASLTQEVIKCLERLPLVHGRGSDGASFRILALDGGGLKGTFTAAALALWEQHTQLQIVNHFDLIAGTSTGGIIALGLGVGLTATDMLKFYKERGPVIFPVTRFRSRVYRTLRHVAFPKYAQEELLKQLEYAFNQNGNEPILRDSLCRLVIPTYNAVRGTSHVFRTPHHPDKTIDARIKATDAALATSAAPTFFTAANIKNMVTVGSYFDGGVWALSPVMAAIVEATCFLGIPLERLDVLSVGTTEEPFTVKHQTRAGVIGWLRKKKILDLLMNVQKESSVTLARELVGDARFCRVDVPAPTGSYSLDGPKEIADLATLGESRAQDQEILVQVKSRFLNGVPVLRWQAYP